MARRLTKDEIVTIKTLAAAGVANRQIARTLGITEGAVRYQLSKEAGADGRSNKPMKAAQVAELIDHRFETHRGSRPINVLELYDELVESHDYSGSYKTVLRYVRKRFGYPPRRTYRRIETPPGAQAQVDWGEFPRVVVDGRVVKLYAFVMVLSHSRKPAVIWSTSMDMLAWLHCHNAALHRLGGVPAVLRIDNLKTGVASGAGPTATINPTYARYAQSMRFHVDPCERRAGNAKGKVESKVRLVRLRCDPSGRVFDSLEALQRWSDDRLERWTRSAICPITGLSVEASWRAELEKLQPLPALAEPFEAVVTRKVWHDCTVHFEGRRYVVPFRFAGQRIEVRACAKTVEFWADGQCVQSHPRHTTARLLLDPGCYQGEATAEVTPPKPLGRMAGQMQRIYEMPVEQRPIDLYAALAKAAR